MDAHDKILICTYVTGLRILGMKGKFQSNYITDPIIYSDATLLSSNHRATHTSTHPCIELSTIPRKKPKVSRVIWENRFFVMFQPSLDRPCATRT